MVEVINKKYNKQEEVTYNRYDTFKYHVIDIYTSSFYLWRLRRAYVICSSSCNVSKDNKCKCNKIEDFLIPYLPLQHLMAKLF